MQTRRGLLQVASVSIVGVLAALTSVPVVGAVLSPLFRRREEPRAFIPAVALNELVVGAPRRVELRAVRRDGWMREEAVIGAVWLLREHDDTVRALSSVCPHSGCNITFNGAEYACPCHDSAFGLDGTPRFGPAPRPMDPLEVEVVKGVVRVRYAKFKPGIKERKET